MLYAQAPSAPQAPYLYQELDGEGDEADEARGHTADLPQRELMTKHMFTCY